MLCNSSYIYLIIYVILVYIYYNIFFHFSISVEDGVYIGYI